MTSRVDDLDPARRLGKPGSAGQATADALLRRMQNLALAGESSACLVAGCRYWATLLGLSRAWAVLVGPAGETVDVATYGTKEPIPEDDVAGIGTVRDVTVRSLTDGSGGSRVVAPLDAPGAPPGALVGEWADAAVGAETSTIARTAAGAVAFAIAVARRTREDAAMMASLDERLRESVADLSTGQRDRRLAQETSTLLRRATARLHAVIDQMPQGVLMVRAPDAEPVLANPVATELLGLDAPGRSTRRILMVDGVPYAPERLPLTRALHGQPSSPEEALIETDRGRRHLLISAVPLAAADGRIEEALMVMQDITPLKEIDRLKSEIIALVSHELRTPLHHIKGFASTLLAPGLRLDDLTRRDFLQSIDQEADRLIMMVTDLLDLAKLDAGAAERAEKLPTDPSDVVRHALRRFNAVHSGRAITFGLRGKLPSALMDRARIERVILNLLSNAVKFTPADTAITVTAEARESSLTVRVIDHGPGVAADERARIFERFYRGTGVAGGGVGLGLSICTSIVEAHGGRIWVEETPGGGATFVFTLPLEPIANGRTS